MADKRTGRAEFKYDSTTIGHRNPLVRAIHRRRYGAVVRTIGASRPHSVLDFGSGTGSLVIQLLQADYVPPVVAAYEPGDRSNAADLAAKLGRVRGRAIDVHFDLDQTDARFDLICSTGVFEHLPLKQRLEAYRLIREHLTPEGRVLIQVPIMIGVGLVVRECVRVAVKNKRFLYGPWELFCIGILARQDSKDRRRHDPDHPEPMIYSHRGFDHRVLLEEIRQNGFEVLRTFTEPFGLPAYVAHSFYIECRTPRSC